MKYFNDLQIEIRKVMTVLIALIFTFITPVISMESVSAMGENKNFLANGISVGAISSMTTETANEEFNGIERAGFSWVRFDFSWSSVQPANSSSYNWGLYDILVTSASQHHLKVLGILDSTPSWAVINGCQTKCGTEDATDFSSFAAAAAERYKGTVNDWEIWNEENTADYWSPSPSAEQYAKLLIAAYPAIKAVNPDAYVVLGGMGGAQASNSDVDGVQFLQQLYADGAGSSFDAVGYHPYTFPETPLDANTAWSEMDETAPSLRSVMTANGDGSKQIWITEYGAPTDGPSGSYVSQASQSLMALEAYNYVRNTSWAGPLFWYTYQDSGISTTTNQNFFGLVKANGSPKIAYYIWRALLR
jgi:GH35 family endo-1,4-beta-xylanase